MADQSMIDALLMERAGYERAGKKDRAAQVDEQLRANGYEAAPARPADAQPASQSRGRRTAKG